VETQRKSTCDACDAKTGCGTQVIGKVVGNRRNRVRVLNKIGASTGDEVVVGLQEGAMLRGSLAMYFAPLVGLFGGAALGSVFSSMWNVAYSDGMQIVASVIGLLAGLWWLKRFTQKIRSDEQYQAVILRKCGPQIKFVEPNIKRSL
jgi:sigma-E factor negative regulatory protein RseC